MRTALTEVKAVLGADAVIMSNTKTPEGIEIVAAVDNDPVPAKANTQSPQQSVKNLSPQAAVLRPNQEVASNFRQQSSQELRQPQASSAHINAYSHDEELSEDAVADSLKALLQRQSRQLEESETRVQPTSETMGAGAPNVNMMSGLSNQRASAQVVNDAGSPLQYQTQRMREHDNSLMSPATNEKTSESKDNSASLDELQAMKTEMSELRKLMEHQVSGLMWQEMARREPVRAYLVDQFNKMGVADVVADQIASFIPEELSQREAWLHGLELLSGQVNVTNNDIMRRGGVVALLGPTGVGKTTTIAKLAANFAQQYGHDQVAMVTTDTFRIGAHEQLMTYAKILGCPCKLVADQTELLETLHQLRNRKLILIDTAGVGQRDMRLAEHLDTLMATANVKIRSYLVLQSTSQRSVLQEAIEQFRRIPITGCIFTKIDECMSLGEILSVAIQNALPIGYLSEGQRVPEDIRAAESSYLVEKATKLMQQQNISQPNWFTDERIQPIYK